MTEREAIHKLIQLRRIMEKGVFPVGYRFDAEPFDMAVEALEKQEKERWIPVTERLPEDGQLIMAAEKSFDAGFYITRYSDTHHFTFPAWRPLLEAYQEEEA